MENTPDSLDLDALLADSLQARDAKKAKYSRTRPNECSKVPADRPRHWRNLEEMSDYERRRHNAELKDLWKPQAAVAMFSVQLCLSCGSRHTHFEGFFQQQRHASYRDTEKWVPATDSTMLKDLPKHKKITLHEADACIDCVGYSGYLDISPTLTEPSHAAWSPRKNHSVYSDQSEYPTGFVRSPKTSPLE